MSFIIKDFRTIVFIFIAISKTFRLISPPAFLGCLSNSGTFMELRTTSFRLEGHQKIKKSGMADHIWKEKGNHLPLWDKVEVIDRAENLRIRCLKESAHMLGYHDLLSRQNIELNTIWEPIIKKA